MVDQHDKDAIEPMQEMFQRVLTGWAMDALSLRRQGLDRPTSREGAGLALTRPADPRELGRLATPANPPIVWRGKAA